MAGRRRRGLSESVALDASLRNSRAVFTLLVIVFVPGAFLSAFFLLELIGTAMEFGLVASFEVLAVSVIEILTILLAINFVKSLNECNRRLRILREDPDARVRPMPVWFM